MVQEKGVRREARWTGPGFARVTDFSGPEWRFVRIRTRSRRTTTARYFWAHRRTGAAIHTSHSFRVTFRVSFRVTQFGTLHNRCTRNTSGEFLSCSVLNTNCSSYIRADAPSESDSSENDSPEPRRLVLLFQPAHREAIRQSRDCRLESDTTDFPEVLCDRRSNPHPPGSCWWYVRNATGCTPRRRHA